MEAQRQSQRSVPGYQLLDGQEVPTNVDQDRLLGYQSWSKPVVNNSLNASLKYQYAFNDQWNGSLSASQSRVVIDDNSAFPWGCYAAFVKLPAWAILLINTVIMIFTIFVVQMTHALLTSLLQG